jgi:uncharacterized membrane protein
MRKVLFRVLAGVAIFLSSTNQVHGQLVCAVSIGNVPMVQLYIHESFWMQFSAPKLTKQHAYQQATELIDNFADAHYDLYLDWLKGVETLTTNKEVVDLENNLLVLCWKLDDVSASVEGDPILQKKNVQDSILKH